MGWLHNLTTRFFERQIEPGEDPGAAYDRMAREIRGSILALITLFLLVALTSYIPIDSFNLFQGRFDHMNNLGGIVGAILGEWFLGTVGIAGYTSVPIAAWLAVSAFRGQPLRQTWPQVLGLTLGAVLASIALQLAFHDKAPEASLLQGGLIGKTAGKFLKQYFNTAGALLILSAGFVVTTILTTGFSFTRLAERIFEGKSESKDLPDEALSKPTKRSAARPASITAPPKPTAKNSRKKKRRNEEADEERTEEIDVQALIAQGQSDGQEEESLEGENTVEEETSAAPGEFEELIPFMGSYDIPTPRLLKNLTNDAKKLSKGELKQNAQRIVEHLLSFQITGEITAITQGPVLTTYEFKPSAGVKLSKIAALQDDLGIVMGTRELRIIAPIPGKTVVGIEVPRPKAEVIALKDCLGEKSFYDKKLKIPVALGRQTDGTPVFGDLAAMPHLLVAGATGSGKSVFINSLVMSFLFRLTPNELRLILVDPKMLELNVFDGIPHLITNVITDNNVAFNALMWAVQEMERRYNLMAETGSKNIDSYNEKQKSKESKLPFIVVVVDELADLMMSGGKMVEVAITRLAQKARAAGIHLVIATQRPSTDVVTGLIKANIPSRLAFKVPSGVDSRTVLDTSGAEELIGRGDCLMIQPAAPLRRLHGTFVTEEDLARVVKYVKAGRDHSKNYIQFPATPPPEE